MEGGAFFFFFFPLEVIRTLEEKKLPQETQKEAERERGTNTVVFLPPTLQSSATASHWPNILVKQRAMEPRKCNSL